MDLTGEAIDRIQRLTERARDAEDFSFETIGQSKLQVTNSLTGAVSWIDVPVRAIHRTVMTVADLLAFVSGLDDVEIWVSQTSVTAAIGKHHDSRVVLPLKLNPAFTVLQSLKDLEPKALIRKLRIDLFQCSTNIDLQSPLSSLKFETNSTAESVTRRNDESIAKSVRSKVTGEVEIPDEVMFTFMPIQNFESQSGSSSVRCAIITEIGRAHV